MYFEALSGAACHGHEEIVDMLLTYVVSMTPHDADDYREVIQEDACNRSIRRDLEIASRPMLRIPRTGPVNIPRYSLPSNTVGLPRYCADRTREGYYVPGR